MSKIKEKYEGMQFQTNNCGVLTIVEYINSKKVKVRFNDTGCEFTTCMQHIKTGKVKDRLYPWVYGVGYLGIGATTRLKKSQNYQYIRWKSMMRRCYCPLYLNNRPAYRNCTVAKEWHNFSNFYTWYNDNYPIDGKEYQIDGKEYDLDKDIKIKGNIVYSPDSCMFVTRKENNIAAQAKTYAMKSPSGETIEIYNMQLFCGERKLDASTMRKVSKGLYRQHKGWTAIP